MTIDLKTAINNASNFIELAPFARNANEDISFFGHRYLYVEGYEGTAGIDAIAARFMDLQKTHFELGEEERVIGKESIPLISKLYESNDSRGTNILTKIFCVLRAFFWNVYNAFFGHGYGIRNTWDIDDGDETFFNSYTASQYEKEFGEPPKDSPSFMRPGCLNRWRAPL